MKQTGYMITSIEKESHNILYATYRPFDKNGGRYWISDKNMALQFEDTIQAKQWIESQRKYIFDPESPNYRDIEPTLEIGRYVYETVEKFKI